MDQETGQGNTSVAWFKLAELVKRGEREKALSVYRLLSHSLEKKAYALQLEGDILWSLDDAAATEKYKQAAFLYQKEKCWIDAAAVCEHLRSRDPSNLEALGQLLGYYAFLVWPEKFSARAAELFSLLDTKKIHHTQFVAMIKNIADQTHELGLAEVRKWMHEQLTELCKKLTPEVARQIEGLLR